MDIQKIKELSDKIVANVGQVIVGREAATRLVITAILAGGHVLVEDMPGTGKTMLTKAMAKSMGCDYKRIQFTPDLMPSDITGLNVYNQRECEFKLVKGPVFTNILLADEINRAAPRTQSSLLEAMEERQVTIDGETMKLAEPFIVLATENPVETTGTYPLPEAQLDRFIMKLSMGQTDETQELDIIERFMGEDPMDNLRECCDISEIAEAGRQIKNVYVHTCIRKYIVKLVMKTRENDKITLGISTRGTLALVRCAQAYAAINGREYVIPDDIKMLAPYVWGHRVNAFGVGSHFRQGSELINSIVSSVEVPVEKWEM